MADKLTNMKVERQYPADVAPSGMPDYPYGLRIELDKDALEKLGIDELPPTGVLVLLAAQASVVRVSSTEELEGEGYASVCLQITDLKLAPVRGEDVIW